MLREHTDLLEGITVWHALVLPSTEVGARGARHAPSNRKESRLKGRSRLKLAFVVVQAVALRLRHPTMDVLN